MGRQSHDILSWEIRSAPDNGPGPGLSPEEFKVVLRPEHIVHIY